MPVPSGTTRTCKFSWALHFHVTENLAKYQPQPIIEFVDSFCQKYLPAQYAQVCQSFANNYGQFGTISSTSSPKSVGSINQVDWLVIDLIEANANPDDICLALKICTNPSCRLYPQSKFKLTPAHLTNVKLSFDVREDPWQWIQALLDQWKNHKAVVDIDGDSFSTIETLRGSNWRGKDCNDLDKHIYPGRKIPGYNKYIDYNCNGISGQDPRTGIDYESELCANTNQLGVGVIGGSACSHFAIRDKWVDWVHVDSQTYSDLGQGLQNEVDWPHMSWATGYVPSSADHGPVDSVYLRLRQRNLCNHRDYQNVAVYARL
jgi:acyloxyacyl hydrolase